MIIKMVCPSIVALEVFKSHYQDFQLEVFWSSVAGLKSLQVPLVDGLMVDRLMIYLCLYASLLDADTKTSRVDVKQL